MSRCLKNVGQEQPGPVGWKSRGVDKGRRQKESRSGGERKKGEKRDSGKERSETGKENGTHTRRERMHTVEVDLQGGGNRSLNPTHG